MIFLLVREVSQLMLRSRLRRNGAERDTYISWGGVVSGSSRMPASKLH